MGYSPKLLDLYKALSEVEGYAYLERMSQREDVHYPLHRMLSGILAAAEEESVLLANGTIVIEPGGAGDVPQWTANMLILTSGSVLSVKHLPDSGDSSIAIGRRSDIISLELTRARYTTSDHILLQRDDERIHWVATYPAGTISPAQGDTDLFYALRSDLLNRPS